MNVFFGDKIIYLSNSAQAVKTGLDIVFVNNSDELKKQYSDFIANKSVKEIVLVNNDLKMLEQWFKSMFTIIEAAGGVVLNDKKEFLFIFRKGKWDLPKGKIEKGETIELAAIREVEEECGILELSIIKPLPTTYHIYEQNNLTILKPSYWFEMQTSYTGPLVPQLQEGITKAEWIKKKNIIKLLPNAYESIQELMKQYV